MLKAVRFDEQDHKEILDYIANYKDVKGKRNESEAMRFLMQKGLESLLQPKEVVASTPAIDVNEIKADLFAQIMAALPLQTHPNNPNAWAGSHNEPVIEQPQFSHAEILKEAEKLEQELSSKPKTIPVPKIDNSNPLLANLLGNINRG